MADEAASKAELASGCIEDALQQAQNSRLALRSFMGRTAAIKSGSAPEDRAAEACSKKEGNASGRLEVEEQEKDTDIADGSGCRGSHRSASLEATSCLDELAAGGEIATERVGDVRSLVEGLVREKKQKQVEEELMASRKALAAAQQAVVVER